MAPRLRTPLPLVFALTLALVGTLALAGTLLVVALNFLFVSQLRTTLALDAERRADYLQETFSRMLWNFATEELVAVGNTFVRDEVVLALTVRTDSGEIVFQQAKKGAALLTVHREMAFTGTKVGDFTLVLSADTLERRRADLAGAATGAVLGLLALLAVSAPFLLNRTVLSPFNRLSRALVGKSGSGPFPDLPEPSSPILELRTFETALVSLNQAVAYHVDELETKVEIRTKELRETQARLVRTETLATLGQLAAGIAHELNTPLGAISSSARNLQNELTSVLIPRLAREMQLPGSADADHFLLEVARLAANLDDFPGAATRRTLKNRWRECGGAPDTVLCDLVTTTGLSALIDELAALSKDGSLEETIRLVAQTSRSLAIVALAAEKGATVVAALRAQVQPNSPQESRPLELRQQIDQALALLENKTKHGIRVDLRSPEKVWILGDQNELGKVWLNLALNAVQAMEGSGTLTVEISHAEGSAVIEVRDTGPGIPEALLGRVFEPFFTTKPTGMGLGLEIVRRVVEKHQGTVTVESSPGKTVFRVVLPEWIEGTESPTIKS